MQMLLPLLPLLPHPRLQQSFLHPLQPPWEALGQWRGMQLVQMLVQQQQRRAQPLAPALHPLKRGKV